MGELKIRVLFLYIREVLRRKLHSEGSVCFCCVVGVFIVVWFA